VLESLLSKHEALVQNPNIAKNKSNDNKYKRKWNNYSKYSGKMFSIVYSVKIKSELKLFSDI
jgi:hypothetical protein